MGSAGIRICRARARAYGCVGRPCRLARARADPARCCRKAFLRFLSGRKVRLGHRIASRRIAAIVRSSRCCSARWRTRRDIRRHSATGFWRSAVYVHPDGTRRNRPKNDDGLSARRGAIAADSDVSLSGYSCSDDCTRARANPRPGSKIWRPCGIVIEQRRSADRYVVARPVCVSPRVRAAPFARLSPRSRASSSARRRRELSRVIAARPASLAPRPSPHRPPWRPWHRRAPWPRGEPGARSRA